MVSHTPEFYSDIVTDVWDSQGSKWGQFFHQRLWYELQFQVYGDL